LQIDSAGLLLAIGTCHFYFTATPIGEKLFPTAIVSGTAVRYQFCALFLNRRGNSLRLEPLYILPLWKLTAFTTLKINDPPNQSGRVAIALIIFGGRVALSKILLKK
jgi:hypothetical protein